MNEAALGFRTHSGWSILVAVTGSLRKPVVLERRRIVMADPAIAGSKQPFHAAEPLDFPMAETLIDRCRDSAKTLAAGAVRAMIADLKEKGFAVKGAGILLASGRPLPELAMVLRSHALIHTAEGEFFRHVLMSASDECLLPVTRIKEREAWDRASELAHLSVDEVQRRVNELGRGLGAPWRQDEKLASLAGWIALGRKPQS